MTRFLATAAALFVAASCGTFAHAQDKPKDDALDRLLKKAADEPRPEAEKPKDGEVKDSALDDLLKKLGETEETPAPNGPKTPGPAGPPPAKPDDVNAGKLQGKTKDLDEHLEELTGRIKKKPPQDGKPQQKQDQDEDSSELSQAIKKMREVEQRLSKPDTGEETRKKQAEIVKELDRLIQMARRQSNSQSMQRRLAQRNRPGNQQGNQPGQENQGTDGKGVGLQKPKHYTPREILAQNKDTWGNLPPQLREEMMNVFKEEPLPTRQALIDRYTLSVSKKSLAGKE